MLRKNRRPNRTLKFLLVTGSIALNSIGQHYIEIFLGEGPPLLLFLPSVIFCAYVGGFWSGVSSSLLAGIISIYLFLEPNHSLFVESYNDQVRITVFIFISLIISYLFERLHKHEFQLEVSNAEKEVLLREIHHRVKNNLSIVSSLLELQASRSKDKDLAVSLLESQRRIIAMSSIHEKLYQSKNLGRIDFGRHVKELVSALYQAYGYNETSFPIQIDIEPLQLEIDSAIPFSLIINELVTNTMKYAFCGRKSGSLSIRLSRVTSSDAFYDLEVSDDGIGFPQDFSLEHSRTLGLKIVQALTRQLDGTVQVNPVPPSGGSSVSLRLKKPLENLHHVS